MKEIVLAGILLSLSTVLKVCCVVALCSADIQPSELEHDHHDVMLAQKEEQQTTQQPLV